MRLVQRTAPLHRRSYGGISLVGGSKLGLTTFVSNEPSQSNLPHSPLAWSAASFVLVAGCTGGDNVTDSVISTATQWYDVLLVECTDNALTAVGAAIVVTIDQAPPILIRKVEDPATAQPSFDAP